MCKLIKNCIMNYQLKKEGYESILNIFSDKLLYWQGRLKSQDDSAELDYFLFNLIRNIDVSRFETDEDIYYYIKACIENKGKRIEGNTRRIQEREFLCEESVVFEGKQDEKWDKDFSDVELRCLLDNLKDKERYILYKRYFLQFTDAELAEELHVSRQSINKTRRKALLKISSDGFTINV